MRKGEKLTLGCVAALLLSCVISTLVLYATGSFKYIFSTVKLASLGQSLSSIDGKFPFEPPIGSGVSEERLSVYLEVCAKVKPSADKVEEWHRVNEGARDGHGKAFRWKASGLVADYLKELKEAFETGGMGPDEFEWIAERMTAAAAAPPPQEKIDAIISVVESIRPLSDNPDIPKEERESLAKEIRVLQDLPEAWGPSAQADWALYKRHETKIKASALGERTLEIATGFSRLKPGHRRVEIGDSPKPTAPDKSPK